MAVVDIKVPEASPQTIEVYLGFRITQQGAGFFALPEGWSRSGAVLEAADLPTIRMRIWRWWHQVRD
jgi:hypothetical protein